MNSVGTISAATSLKTGWPSGPSRNSSSGMNTGTSRARARRKSVCMVSRSGSGSHRGSVDSTSVAPSLLPRIVLISWAAAVTIGSSALAPRGYTIDSRMIPRRMPLSVPGFPVHRGVARVRCTQYRCTRHGREGIARIVIAGDRVLQGVEDFGAIADRAAENAAAVAVNVRSDGAAVEAEQGLVRQDQRHGIMIGRAAAGGPGFLAEAGHHQIGTDRHARPRA